MTSPNLNNHPARSMTRARSGQSRWRIAGILFLFIWFFVGGIGHFVLTSMFASVVPDYVPMHRAVVLATDLCEIAAAPALFCPQLRHIVGLCLLLLTVCVTPVHIEMLRHADQYRAPGLPALWGGFSFSLSSHGSSGRRQCRRRWTQPQSGDNPKNNEIQGAWR